MQSFNLNIDSLYTAEQLSKITFTMYWIPIHLCLMNLKKILNNLSYLSKSNILYLTYSILSKENCYYNFLIFNYIKDPEDVLLFK